MVLSPRKTSFFGLTFYEMFMLFTNTLPEVIFRVLKCQPKRKNTILGAFWNSGRHQSGPLERQFSPRDEKGQTWSRLGGILAPRSAKVWILDGFWTIEEELSINSVYLLAQSNSQSWKITDFRFRCWVQYFDCLPLRIDTWCRHSIRKMISASRRIFWDGFQPF